ncbi:hypothetical protein [Chryseobacterium luteum]|nr:hypothetical protein [Chryseobacterium luteum]
MKTFTKYDFYIQLLFLAAGVLAAVSEGILFFYFIVGIPQLISFIIRVFQKNKKTVGYIIYGIFIIPVWISLLMIFLFKHNHDVTDFFGSILMLSLFYSLIMAIIYVFHDSEYISF